jgi:homoserine kinase
MQQSTIYPLRQPLIPRTSENQQTGASGCLFFYISGKDPSMLSFHDAASVAAAPSAVSDPHLQQLLTEAVRHWEAAELLNL